MILGLSKMSVFSLYKQKHYAAELVETGGIEPPASAVRLLRSPI